MCFGKISSPVETKTVTVDIDPLAAHPPHDIKKYASSLAIARVERPASATAGLAAAISDTSQDYFFSELLSRMADYALARLAKKMYADLGAFSNLPERELDALLQRVVAGQSQQVWNLTKWVLNNFKNGFQGPNRTSVGAVVDFLIAHDANSPNGLSSMASAMLELSKSALVFQMKADINAACLDERRIAQLMGEGPGAAIVGTLALLPITELFSYGH